MKAVFGKMLPQNLTNDQFLMQEPVCINILDKVQTKANSLDKTSHQTNLSISL
jgi:hypothetical protein